MRPGYQPTVFSFFCLAALILALIPGSAARAAGIVSVCDETHLLAALSGGGAVTFSCSGVITMSGQWILNSDTTLDGAGQNVTISGGGTANLFNVSSGVTFDLKNLTVVDAYIDKGGGAISNGGTMDVTNCSFSNNESDHAPGGVIYNYGALTVLNSTFSGNRANVDHGGAIYNDGTLTITNSTFSGNRANTGGAIYNDGTLTITNSTFSDNSAAYAGGGIEHNSGTTTVRNSIVANSTSGGNCSGDIGGANNLADDDTCDAGFTYSASINLDALSSNGGPTQTIPLLVGSSAIDAGYNAVCAAAPVNGKDQRGYSRYSGTAGTVCDIGAYELGAVAASSNANLSNLVLSSGALTPAFASGTTSYTQSVVNIVSTLTVTPTVTDSTATVKVNGLTVASGSASGAIALNIGANTITTVVTAQDGVTTQTYTVTVTRAAGGGGGGDVIVPSWVIVASDGLNPGRVRVDWTPFTGASYYLVYRSESLDGPKIPTEGYRATSPGGDDLWAVPGVTFYYWVRACTDSGCGEFYTYSYDTGWQGLAAPVITASDGLFSDKVQVSWSPVFGASSYLGYRAESLAGTQIPVNGYLTTFPGGDDIWALPGVTYFYWVKACNGLNCSPLSAVETGWK
jgi:predicted outer membrane repeat protein